jgi:hypothetical protein
MEKNGAITTNTPRCGGGCGCGGNCSCKTKTASAKQLLLFPETKEIADNLDQDLIKQAVELVKDSSKPAQ